MIFRFDDFELDAARRELRRAGRPRAVQPRVFAMLEYLIRHCDRVVSKTELLEKLWPDLIVTDASVQRAISLARDAIDDAGSRIRTVPKQGYRFVAQVRTERPPAPAADAFQPRFARSGDVHIAYHAVGEGPVDLVVMPAWVMPMRALYRQAGVQAWLERLAALGRVILFDKRGTGLSDRVKSLPTLEQRVDDLRAVLDAVGSTDAILIGISEGGTLCLVYAASLPERVRGVVLVSAFARWTAAPDYPQGWSPQTVQKLREYIDAAWGRGHSISAPYGKRAKDPDFMSWAAQAEVEGASPGAARDLLEMNQQIDVRPALPAISVSTVVLHNTHDQVSSVENGRYLAAHIPGARLIEADTDDHTFMFEGADIFFDAVKELVARPRRGGAHFLATILAVERDSVDADATQLEETVARFKGMSAGVARVWSFDGPQRAIQCAQALRAQLRPPARIGVHAGEVAREEGRLRGETVDSACALAQATAPGEVWVSQVLRDLVHGSPFAFVPRPAVALPDGRSMT
ncbi:MAG: alpha/beta fold hydrolase, partial [Sulfurifustis sp.]